MSKIEITNLSKKFGDLTALGNLSLKVEDREFLCIVGPSGCGKTTLLNLIAGLEKPTDGLISINGSAVGKPGFDRGMLFQEDALLPWRTVLGNIEFGLEIKGLDEKERKEIAQKYVKLIGLEGFEKSYPYELSGGMLQRTALARVLAYNPEILLMDEPFASVDALTRERLQSELMHVWSETKKTVVFVTHSIEEAIYLSDRVAVMSARPGRIKETLKIPLRRPREGTKTLPEFAELRNKIWELLREEIK